MAPFKNQKPIETESRLAVAYGLEMASWWLSGKESSCDAGDCLQCKSYALIPGLGRSPGEGNGNPLQYSCWKNPMDIGAWDLLNVGLDLVTKPPPLGLREGSVW